jgi:hypothetical protein
LANVLQLDASTNSALVEFDSGGTTYSSVWLTADVAFDAAYLTGLLAQSTPQIVLADLASSTGQQTLEITQIGGAAKWHWNGTPSSYTPPVPVTALQFYRVELHSTAGSPQLTEIWVDGVSVGSITVAGTLSADIEFFDLRASGGWSGKVYIDSYKAGTTRGGTEIFSDAFEGTLSGWSFVSGADATIVADPGIAAANPGGVAIHGVLIAFDAPVLEETPVWTSVGDLAGVSVQQVQVTRGRPTERDKTQVGTATIAGVCTTGILDPTYGAGSLFGKLDPMKQVKIELQNPVDLTWSPVFRGFVSDLNYELEVHENTYSFTIECEDALAIISDAEVIPDVAGNTVPLESTGDVYYDPVADNEDRILAAVADTATTFNPYGADWPAGGLSIASGNTQVKGTVYSPRTSLLQVIDDAADADLPWGSNRYVSRTGIITFKGRLQRFDPTNPDYAITFWTVGDEAAFAGDSATAVISSLKFTRGKTNLINAALVTPTDIKDSEIAGQFSSDGTSITAYGARSISFENLATDGSSPGAAWGPTTDLQETKLMADGLVANYKDPLTRISELTFRPQGSSGARATAVAALICGVELNDVLTTTTTHPGGGGFAAEDQFVESVAYSWDVEGGAHFTNVTLTVEVSPRANWTTNPFV